VAVAAIGEIPRLGRMFPDHRPLAAIGLIAPHPGLLPVLAEMERVVPWSALCALIEPFYPKPGKWPPAGRGRTDAIAAGNRGADFAGRSWP